VKNLRQSCSAGIASGVATALDLALLVVLVRRGVSVALATFVAALAGAAMSFALNKYVAFRDRSPLRLAQILRFDLVALVAALLVAAAMKVATGALGAPIVAAKLASAALVFAVWTYPAQRRLVFARGVQAEARGA
jgi:putative flippase GtrA